MKVYFPAPEPGAFIDQPPIKGVVHPRNPPSDVFSRADSAAGVAGVGGFNPNHVWEGMLGKIVHAPANPAHGFGQHIV
jgi:hypothetical protein